MNKIYAVVFDNDPEYPGKLQFVELSYDPNCLESDSSNVTEHLDYAEYLEKDLLNNYPLYNYRVVEIIVKELE